MAVFSRFLLCFILVCSFFCASSMDKQQKNPPAASLARGFLFPGALGALSRRFLVWMRYVMPKSGQQQQRPQRFPGRSDSPQGSVLSFSSLCVLLRLRPCITGTQGSFHSVSPCYPPIAASAASRISRPDKSVQERFSAISKASPGMVASLVSALNSAAAFFMLTVRSSKIRSG